ncbi:hypothetical protein [Alloactinosynnema sp. L-07]|uniref:AAA family ATPase n=1 Tax=Alloactinosynnema sp. L-07 TaxID=1653480 RepID=UPI00065EF715|nr:ATP-binding protein [Alloactinosynnema sp. L-07]CRK62131.1 hypothetical protein [Alloactinosynnema sp. L-07]
MPGMVTVLTAAFDARAHDVTAGAHDIALRFGGHEITDDEPTEPRVVSAVFHSVCDATRASLEIASMVALAESDTGDPLGGLRIVLCAAVDAPESPIGTQAMRHARTLLAKAAPGQILATAPTAVVAGPTLPAGIELLDRGFWTPLPDAPPERVYEMCVGGATPEGTGTSNLEWARRALHDPAATVVVDVAEALRTATSVWPEVQSGNARMVLVYRGSAADRMAVTAELVLRLHAEGALVLYGRWTAGTYETYRAFREALGFHAAACATDQLVTDLQGWADEIAHLLPDLGARVGGTIPGRGGSTYERAGMFDAVGHWVRAITSRVPTILVLDDAHRADPTSISLLSHLWHSCRSSGLMVVATATETPVADRLADVVVHPDPSALVRIPLS